MYLAIHDQLTGFGLDDEQAEYTVGLAREVLAKDVDWSEEGNDGWKRIVLPVSASTGAPIELTELRLNVQRAAETNESKATDARHNAFLLFAIGAAAATGKAQDVRVIGFGEGQRYEFSFRASLNGRGTVGFFRPRKVEGDADTVPAGGSLTKYERHRKEAVLIDTMTLRRAKDLLPA